jgi:hypothetical protein
VKGSGAYAVTIYEGDARECASLVPIGGGGRYLTDHLFTYLVSTYRLSTYRLSTYRLGIFRLGIFRLCIYRLGIYRLLTYRLPSSPSWLKEPPR